MALNRSSFGLFRMTTPFRYILRQAKCIENLIKPASLGTWLYNRKKYLKNHVGFYSNTVIVDADCTNRDPKTKWLFSITFQSQLADTCTFQWRPITIQCHSVTMPSPFSNISFSFFFFLIEMIVSWYRNLYKINLWYEFSIGSKIYILFIKTRKNSFLYIL